MHHPLKDIPRSPGGPDRAGDAVGQEMAGAVSRRRFLGAAAGCAFAAAAAKVSASPVSAVTAAPEARHYLKLAKDKVQCGLCPWACLVDRSHRGKCGVRENQGGVYRSLVYGRIAASHTDPIEKKPFFHFLPGSAAYSLATVGCNFDCKFCQNWDLSQARPEETDAPFSDAASTAEKARRSGATIIAYTYSEPTVFNEFVFDVASAGRRLGLKNAVVSNGFIQKKPLADLAPMIDGYKVDLKSFEDGYYRKVCAGRLKPVLDTLVSLKSLKVWTEIVYLIVPSLNDGAGAFENLSRWILRELGPDVPLHFSRFYPQYKLKNLAPTPAQTLERAWKTARDAGLHFVYLGNIPGHEAENTVCPGCGKILIRRMGFEVIENHMVSGKCAFCRRAIPGVWT
jgi:pyruvate formate lyase activating enzyme